MKFLSLALIFVSTAAFAAGAKPSHASGSAEFQLRQPETQTLDNGLVIYWLPDQSLPSVSMQMMFKSGSGEDPVGKEGVAGFTGAMLEKGTSKRAALRISEDMEQIGSEFGVDVEPDYTVVTSSALSFNKDAALQQYGELILTPTFPHTELERHRKLVLASLQKLADQPDNFSEYLMPKFIFGSQHPYGHESSGTPRSIKSLKKYDLEQYYSHHYVPGNAVLAVTGQFDDAWKKKVVATFSKWKAKKTKTWDPGDFPAWKGTELLLVNRDDLNQAQIQIGFKGIPRNIPEYMELRAALKVLGESFGSRLFEEIREKRGLTYHIHAWFDPRLKAGPMGIYTFTRIDKIGETVEETLKTYKQFVDKGVTDAEVTEVKALMRGQFPRMFETPEALAKQLLILNRYGVSQDYLANYLANLDAITKDSINASIKKYFDPSNMKILVYAPKAKAEETLKKLGKVEIKDYKEFLQ
jgi:zinc protease